MIARFSCFAALGLTGWLAASSAPALEVPLLAGASGQVARAAAIVTSGIPFARGEVRDLSRLALTAGGREVPAQFAATVAWDDGSVRWALMDTQIAAPADGPVPLLLSDSGRNAAPAAPVLVEESVATVKLATGGLALLLAKRQPGLVASLTLDGRELLTAASKGLVLVLDGGAEVQAGAPSEVKVEQAVPLRATVCLRGKFPGVHNGLLGYTARVSLFAGQRFVKVHLWLENQGAAGYGKDPVRKPEWFAFDGLAVDLGLGLGGTIAARCEGVEARDALKVLQVCKKTVVKYGEHKPYYPLENLAYTVTSRGKELKQGARTDGVVEIKGTAGALTVAVRDFWQNYEKAIEVDGDCLRLWLWPLEGQWPRAEGRPETGPLQNIVRDNLNVLQGSVHKGHEFVLDFSGRPAAETLAELAAPLFARATAERYAATDALPVLFAPPGVKSGHKECDFKLSCWDRMSRSMADPTIPSSIAAARENYEFVGKTEYTRWHGWMDFGDISVLGQQVSLRGDWPLLLLLEYLRHGDAATLRMAGEMVRHRIDIDQCWSDRDPAPGCRLQRGGQDMKLHFSGKGLPGVGGNWVAGMALWHLLTGEPKAREACLRNVEGLAAAWEEIARTRPYGGPQGSMSANGWGIESFCAVHDLTGDRRWLDEALKLFDTNVTAKWKSAGPHLHRQVGIVGQGYSQEDRAYCWAIAPLCNLHRRSRDANVLKLLVEGCEKPFPDSYFDAPMFVAGLFAYTGAATGNPDYRKQAAKLFFQGFPESRCPPVVQPGDNTWLEKSIMLLRAGYPVAYSLGPRRAGQ
jgi:hypothetical protein